MDTCCVCFNTVILRRVPRPFGCNHWVCSRCAKRMSMQLSVTCPLCRHNVETMISWRFDEGGGRLHLFLRRGTLLETSHTCALDEDDRARLRRYADTPVMMRLTEILILCAAIRRAFI